MRSAHEPCLWESERTLSTEPNDVELRAEEVLGAGESLLCIAEPSPAPCIPTSQLSRLKHGKYLSKDMKNSRDIKGKVHLKYCQFADRPFFYKLSNM